MEPAGDAGPPFGPGFMDMSDRRPASLPRGVSHEPCC